MMQISFTDDDLKRLKEEFEHYGDGDPRILTGSDWLGLVARLEAAETSEAYLYMHYGDSYGLSHKLHRAWRKAAGK